MKKILSFLIISLSVLLNIPSMSAGFVPGTIEKKTFTSSSQSCDVQSNSYRTWFSCSQKTCQQYNYWENSACGCKEYQQVQDECTEYNNDATCAEYETTKVKKCTATWGTSCRRSSFIIEKIKESCADVWGFVPEGCSRWSSEIIEQQSSICKTYNNDATCKTWSYKDGPTCETYNSCRTSGNGCQTWSDSRPIWDTDSYNDYNFSKSDYTFGSQFSNALPEDVGLNCYTQADGTKHSAPYGNRYSTCDTNNGYYQPYGGSNGVCNDYDNKNTLLNSFDQLGWANFSEPVQSNRTCKIEGRVAQLDNQWPSITVTWSPFKNSVPEEWWCNIEKYTSSGDYEELPYGSDASPTSWGCEFYGWKWWKDLFENLKIEVQDPSGLQEIKIEIWSCTVVYDKLLPENNTLEVMLVDNNSPSWIQSQYTEPMGLYYKAPSEYADYRSNISIRGMVYNQNGNIAMDDFWTFDHDEVLRIDQLCLQEGKNYMTITAKDASTSDGYTLDGNVSTYSTLDNQWFIKVDNSGVEIWTTWDQPSDTDWYNKNVQGKFSFLDTYESWVKECTTFVKSDEKWTCSNTKPENSYWTSPYWVNAQWEFPIFTCDGKEVFPPEECNWSCESGYQRNGDTCEKIVQPSSCWEIGRSEIWINTEVCEYVPVYSWYSVPTGICYNGQEPVFVTCKNDLGQTVDQKYCNQSEKPAEFKTCNWNSIIR